MFFLRADEATTMARKMMVPMTKMMTWCQCFITFPFLGAEK
jgi:hypothetical protein